MSTIRVVLVVGEAGYIVWIGGVMQRPVFNSRGAALAFAQAVVDGKRKPEPATARGAA